MIVPQTVVCLKIFTWILIPFGTTEIFNVPLDYSPVDKSCQALFYTKKWIAYKWLKLKVLSIKKKSRTAFMSDATVFNEERSELPQSFTHLLQKADNLSI
jgi:hypothetical protein